MEKLGMRREGHFRESVLLADGKWHDEYFLAITDKEWFEKQPYHEPRAKPQRLPDLTSVRESACHCACISGCAPLCLNRPAAARDKLGQSVAAAGHRFVKGSRL